VFSPLGLDHVVLRVRDPLVSQRFYVDLLGCTLDHVNESISLTQLRFGDHLIDLLPATSEGEGVGPRSGLDHVCLSIRCDDLGKVGEQLRARGVTVQGEIAERRGAFGTGPSLYILDPDGYVIELKPR
jgi:glyoxylase I family protein